MSQIKFHQVTQKSPMSRKLPYMLQVAFTHDSVDHLVIGLDEKLEYAYVKAVAGIAMVTCIPFDSVLEQVQGFCEGTDDNPFDSFLDGLVDLDLDLPD